MRKRYFLTGTILLAAVVCLIAIIGCETTRDEAPPKRNTPVFSHKVHVIDQELKCAICHKLATKGEQAGMPTQKSCMKCHDGIDEKKPPERRILAYMKGDNPQFSSVTQLSSEIKFSHKVHIDAKVECATCHKGIETSAEVSASRLRQNMKDCMDCHAQTHVGNGLASPNGCAVCHTYVNKEWKPENHNNNWKQLHGRSLGFHADLTQTCALCHTQKSCVQCHKVEQPTNHTNYWRQRGHGVTADLDRSTCKACHTEDTCIRCHQTTPPANHRGNWDAQHCQGCHEPLKDNGCIACHKNDKSHLAAPKLPNTQVHRTATASDCRTCHFGLKLKHIDNGDSCLSCHKR